VKLKHLDVENARRNRIAAYYNEHIKNNAVLLPQIPSPGMHVWHLYVVRTSQRDRFQKYLSDNGVQTVIHYPLGPHQQVAYKELNKLSLPVSEKLHQEVISLPVSPVMTDEQVIRVVEVVNQYE
jgi:dTDP-4-amino-4,6-dideoxygalactose transaminase